MGMTALMQASLEGDEALIDYLLEHGADPNHINDDGHHALWFAWSTATCNSSKN